ncbi:MAG: DUF2971 domain-containing protein [Ghiorsea sp.]|nr:DUF2971 domain-containing protein [Ghiorsea sp.]
MDKFIDLLSKKKLFLTPLDDYQNTDPFEGFVPKVAFQETMGIHLKSIEEAKAVTEKIESLFSPTLEQFEHLEKAKEMIKDQKANLISRSNKISKSTCVSCWYHSESESEAMWKLYSDSGKGIAIKTSVSSLVKSINFCEPQIPLRLGKVKYLDFLCNKLSPKDCVTDGVLSPLLKRKEYAHENEVRLYSVPQLMTAEKWDAYTPKPMLIDVNVSEHRGQVLQSYISPP